MGGDCDEVREEVEDVGVCWRFGLPCCGYDWGVGGRAVGICCVNVLDV